MANSKKFLETDTFAKNIPPSYLNTRKSEELLVALDILVALYERVSGMAVTAFAGSRQKLH